MSRSIRQAHYQHGDKGLTLVRVDYAGVDPVLP